MGSEHYCLRWNNHQSNLLGVFSQLLQDESLVDVTLACSEGAPIRAHKVVLSACSSYFQSLFLDHPEKHPIVILKDVRFAELQTLVEFMYKGEVNVQYCQLSALLKTAESLKVKGLAEMTNQNTTLREPEREPERLRPHSQPCKRSNSCDSPVDATLSGPSTSAATLAASISSTQHAAALAASALTTATLGSSAASSTSANTSNATTCTIASSATSLTSAAYSSGSSSSSHQASLVSSKRDHPSERCSPSPPKRLHAKHEQITPQPLDLYQRRLEHQQQEDTKENSIVNNNSNEKHRSSTPHTASGTIQKHSSSSDGGGSSGNVGGEGIKKREDIEKDSIRNFNSPDRLTRHDVVCRPTDDLMAVEGIAGGVEKIDDVEDVEYGDEEMELDDDGDNNSDDVCLNMKIRSSSLAAALVSPQLAAQRCLESSGHSVGGIGGIEGGVESARSTPLTTTIPLAFDTHSQRPASRSSREGSGMDRPSSRGGLGGLPSTSASALGGGLSPASSTAAALGLHSDTVPGSSGLGPVQSVPLSLKKEIDCSEDDNSNSRHHLQPRSASASGVLGGDLDYRTPHESETSDSPHGLGGIANAGGGRGSGSGGGGGLAGTSSATTSNTASSFIHEQPQTPPPYTCGYCGAGFPNQNKLTRHILSHSLKTLEYRETATHALLHPHLLAHDLNMSPLAFQMNAAMASASGDAQEQAAAVAAAVAMDMDFAAAIAAAGGCPFPSLASCTARGLDLDGSGGVGGGGSSSSSRAGRDGCAGNGGNSSASGNGSCPSSSLSLLSGTGSSTSAAAAAAAAAASTSASCNDPNSVVLCKFCGKSFPDVTSLITHLPIHTGDRPFKCEFCGKAFKLRHHMKDHCRVHTGERPFRCQMCGKTFSRSTILKAHEKTHFPKYARKFLSPSPVDTKDELPQ